MMLNLTKEQIKRLLSILEANTDGIQENFALYREIARQRQNICANDRASEFDVHGGEGS